MGIIDKRNKRRRTHYLMLITAGYDSKLATKLKDYSYDRILKLCELKENAMKSIDEIDRDVQKRIETLLYK